MFPTGFPPSPPAGIAAALRDQGYRVETRLGEGASGEVWRAVHPASGREVAVKILKTPAGDGSPDPGGHRWEWRFQREVEAAAILDHPNICRMLDSGFLPEGGQAWMAMELVDGPPLTTYAEEEKMNAPRRVELFQKVCAGVAHAHHRGVLHRDLKPANIPVHHDGTPKVLDFGLARFLNSEAAPGPAVSRAGVLLGTPAYMAPEQIDGPAEPDTRSDIYSLGVVLYELLTGTLPHEAPPGTAALLAAIVRGEPRPPKGVHPDLAAILMKALRKDPSERYHSADSLSDDLGRHLRGEPVRARQGQMWYAARRHLRKHRKAVAGWSLLAAGFAGLAGYTVWQRNADLERRARMLEEARDAMEEMLVDAGTEARAAGRPELANRMAERMAAIPWNWAEEHGGGFDLRRHKSVSARLRADMEASELRYQKAVPLYFEASSAAAGLAADFPNIPRFQMDTALARMGLGLCLTEMEKSREAGDSLRYAVGLLQKLPREMAGRELAKALRALGRLETNAKRPEAAAEAYTEALRALEGSGDSTAPGERELIRLDHARVTPHQGGPAEADAALAALLAAAELPAAAVTDQVRLSEGLIAHAAAMQACGAWKKAAASLSEARAKHRTLLDAGLATQRFKTGMTLGKMLRQCAEGMIGAGETQDALETLGAALDHMRDFRTPGSPYDAEVRTELARILRSRAAAEERAGITAEAATNFSKAANRLAECAKLQRGRPGTHLEAAEAGLNAWRLRDAAGLTHEGAEALLKRAGEQIRAAESKGSLSGAEKERVADLTRKLETARAGAG